jgi:hypothetical protein
MASELRVDRIVPTTGVPTGGAGGVIKIVQDTYNTESSTANTSYTETGLSVNITPTSSSNKVLVLFNLPLQKAASNLRIATALHRGGSNIYNTNLESCFNNASSQATETVSGMFLDSPATTSQVTYDVRVKVSSGSGTFYWAVSGCVCTITAMEVSA